MTLQDAIISSHFLDTTKHVNWLLLNLRLAGENHMREKLFCLTLLPIAELG